MIIKRVCPACGVTHCVSVRSEEYEEWKMGRKLCQEAMPRLSVTEREQLISGMCPGCQAKFFGGDK